MCLIVSFKGTGSWILLPSDGVRLIFLYAKLIGCQFKHTDNRVISIFSPNSQQESE